MFESFSEISRLYAQNYPVIEAVRKQYQGEVNDFLESVYQEVQSATPGTLQQTVTTAGWRYWWVGGEEKDLYPQLSMSNSAPEIVHPGEVKFFAQAPRASVDQLRSLAGIATRPEFSGVCKAGSGGRYSLFTATVKYEDERPVQRVAEIAVSLLLALNSVYESPTKRGAASSA